MAFYARTGQGRIAHHVTKEPTTVVGCLAKHFKLDSERIDELFSLGAIYSDKRRVLGDAKIGAGAYLRIHLQPKRFPVERIDWRGIVVHEEPEFIVVNKPAGIPVHATVDNLADNVLQQLRNLTGQELLVTQRLDVQVSGLFVLAKTPLFQRKFNEWLGDRRVDKRYRALVTTAPELGHQVHFMEPSPRGPKKVVREERPNWIRCELTLHSATPVNLAGFDQTLHEVEVELHTGRTHQIRAQLQALGSPIVGDRAYGSRLRAPFPDQVDDFISLASVSLAWPRYKMPPWEFKLSPLWEKLKVATGG